MFGQNSLLILFVRSNPLKSIFACALHASAHNRWELFACRSTWQSISDKNCTANGVQWGMKWAGEVKSKQLIIVHDHVRGWGRYFVCFKGMCNIPNESVNKALLSKYWKLCCSFCGFNCGFFASEYQLLQIYSLCHTKSFTIVFDYLKGFSAPFSWKM